MTFNVLIGAGDPDVLAQAAAVLEETGDATVVERVRASGEVVAALRDGMVEIAVLHEGLGPLPTLDLARQVSARFPEVAIVLVVADLTPEVLRAALRAGVREVVTLPFTVEDIAGAVQGAGSWSRSVRDRVHRHIGEERPAGGGMITLVGAKGGVGTTTLAVHLALAAARASSESSVCLVDLDLQAGDVRSVLDISAARGLTDLLEVADEISGRQLEDGLYLHASRLRILLPPEHGEDAEDIGTRAARQVLGAIRTHFDIVIVDAGTLLTDATAVATEMADRVLIVTTPDVPALRAANRLLGLWTRLQVRKDGIGVILNRASKDAEVQPELVGRVIGVPVLRTTVPAAFRELEAPGNTGVPDRLEDGAVRRSITALGQELQVLPGGVRTRRRLMSRESGTAGLLTLLTVPIVIVLVLALFQMVLAGLTTVLAGNAATEAARLIALGQSPQPVIEAIPGAWGDSAALSVGAGGVEVAMTVPALAGPWVPAIRVTGRAGMVPEANL
jgi:pilus assembly protein CpaE